LVLGSKNQILQLVF